MKLLKTSATFFSRENHLDFLEVDGKCEEEEGLCLTSRYYPGERGGRWRRRRGDSTKSSARVKTCGRLVMKHETYCGKMAKQIPGERGGRSRRRRGDSTKE